MVCNPSLNNITCPPNLISDPFTSIPSCPNFSGWSAAGGTPDYFTGDIECGNPAFCIQTPIDPSMIGFRTYSDFPCNTPQTPYTEAVQGIVSVAPNQPYIFSFFRTIEPQEPETTQNPGNLQLENLSVFLTDAFTYVPMGLTINCLPIPANNTPQRFDVYAEANIAQVAWRQGLACFTIPPGGSNYSRLAFMGYENSGRMFTLIDRVDIIEDHFPFGVHNLTTDCLSPLTIGDSQTCGTVPNLTYQWQMSLDGINWTDIAGANQPTYQVPAITVTTWYRLNRFMNTSAPVFAPLANPSMANCVTASAIYVITPVGSACCTLATANTYFAQPNGSPHFTVTSSQTWQPGLHPFTGYQGTISNPIRVNGTITVNPSVTVSMQNLNFEFGPNGRIVIEPTAAMTISGCNLTGDPVCQTMWQGIRVVGSGYNIIPDASNAGSLHIETSSVLHALIGAANLRLPVFNLNSIATITDSGSGVYPFVNFTSQAFPQIWSSDAMLSSGGIITTNNAQFVNCFQDINLSWQNKPATTTVSNCTFSHNTALSANGALWYPFNTVAQTETGIFVLNYRHVTNIQQCTFNHIKYGIRSNACFSLQVQNNAFNQCEIGVSARKYGTSMSSASYILSNNFEDNYIAIQTDGDNTRIYRNNINRQNPNPLAYRWYSGSVTAGILLRASTFAVGNTPGIMPLDNFIDNVTFGILPISNYSLGGSIKNNHLTNSTASVFALGNNKNVEIKCNDLHKYQLFGLGLAAWNAELGHLDQQGECDVIPPKPAGNSFIPAIPIVYTDIWRDIPNSSGFVYEDINTTSLTASPDITLNECFALTEEDVFEYCNGLGGVRSREEIVADPDETKRNREGAILLDAYLAAGDTIAALQLLEDISTTEASRLLSGERIERGQISLAQSLLNNLPRQTEEDDNFFKLQQILLDMVDNGQEVIDINSMQEGELLNIAATTSHTAYLAQSLLYTAKGQEFPLQLPQLPGIQGNGYTAFKSGSDNLPVSELYPNPANQTAQLNYRLPDQTTATLTIYDLTGRILHNAILKNNGIHTVPVHNYTAGIYYYTISINGVPHNQNKLFIVN